MDIQNRTTIRSCCQCNNVRFSGAGRLVLVAMFLFLSISGGMFAGVSLPSAKSRQTSERIYRQISTGELFPISIFTGREQRAEYRINMVGACDAESMLGRALIELKLVEVSLSNGQGTLAEKYLQRASLSARKQVSCSPTNGFAWFVAFWSAFLAGDLTEGTWEFIDASYKFAPHEAWVALIRLPLLVRLWEVVPAGRRHFILDDFEMLLNEGYVTQCARLYAFGSTELQQGFAGRLSRVAEVKKHQFNYSLRVYETDPIATEQGERDATRLRNSIRDLSEAMTRIDGH
ncbi:hypothetical protein [Methylosinus sp. LW4]|uniref:hypothetical protein n=1 Tax=Methylosinus sp. LW4 TaxID=136993 RepID=UPI0012FC6C7C|nr:hypothetical protein [Methylosinus sp. LW4]